MMLILILAKCHRGFGVDNVFATFGNHVGKSSTKSCKNIVVNLVKQLSNKSMWNTEWPEEKVRIKITNLANKELRLATFFNSFDFTSVLRIL